MYITLRLKNCRSWLCDGIFRKEASFWHRFRLLILTRLSGLASVPWGEVGNVRGQTVWILRLQKFAANFLVLEPKIVFFLEQNPIRGDFLSFRFIGWLVVIWYDFKWCVSLKKNKSTPCKQMRETNSPSLPFDVFLFYHWERWEKVDHVRHRGLQEWFANRFSPRPYFAGLFRALQAPCGVAINS